jgi:hypothetical protein
MRIHEFHAENFKRIKVVDVVFPDSGTVEICGSNGAGKSSCLDSIWAALGGTDASPDLPIRTGSTKATVALNLGEYTVERVWTAKGSSLTVKDASGDKQRAPQTILDGLFSRLAFDPLEFTRQKASEQAETLRRVAGINFAALDFKRATAYTERTEVNRAAKQQESILLEMPEVEVAEEVDSAELNAQLQTATTHNQKVADARRILDRKEDEVSGYTRNIKLYETKRADARARIVTASAEYNNLDKATGQEKDTTEILRQIALLNAELQAANDHNKLVVIARSAAQRAKDEVAAIGREIKSAENLLTETQVTFEAASAERNRLAVAVPTVQDIAPILAAISSAGQTNRQARAYAERQAASERLQGIREQAEDLTQDIADIDAERQRILTAAAMPVEELSLDGDMVTFKGIPFAQASTSEQIRVSLAMAAALNPKLRLIIIKEGSLLDEKNLKLIAAWSEQHDYQVILERVADKALGVGVVISEGLVRQPSVLETL